MNTNKFKFSIYFLLFLCLFACAKNEKPIYITKTFTINEGDTLSKSLLKSEIDKADSDAIIKSLSLVFNPRRCRINDTYEIVFDTTNVWHKFTYKNPGPEIFIVEKSTFSTIISSVIKLKLSTQTITTNGIIKTSLWESMRAKNIDPDVIINFAEIFSWQIDFLTETRQGDNYRLVWESQVSENGKRYNKDILGAQYISGGRTHTAILYINPEGKKGYYNIEGESLYRAFLRAPLQFRRISSYFSRNRFHPILKIARPHLGIDYSAPTGTPVSSIGDGAVTFAGWSGGFGKLVKVRHANGFESQYGHLHGFGKKIRRGAHVWQGQVVGFVGSTGLSTGPHLDFRITKNGSFINFLTLKIPPSKNIPKKEEEAFKAVVRNTLSKIVKMH